MHSWHELNHGLNECRNHGLKPWFNNAGMNQSARIKSAMEASDRTPADIAAHCGISVQAVYKWLNEPDRNIRPAYLFKLADTTGHNARWLATGEGPRTPTINSYETPIISERIVSPYQAHPDTVATQLISGIHAMLRVAGLPVTCLGHNPAIREALMSGKAPKTYTADHIHAAVVELATELQWRIQYLSGEQIADLLTDKLRSWVDIPTTPNTITPPENPG